MFLRSRVLQRGSGIGPIQVIRWDMAERAETISPFGVFLARDRKAEAGKPVVVVQGKQAEVHEGRSPAFSPDGTKPSCSTQQVREFWGKVMDVQ